MMKFLANHNYLAPGQDHLTTYFAGTSGPMMVALMQFFGAVFTETINILSICSLENTKEVIMNFIALGVIAEIDNYYLSALPPSELKCRLEEPFEIKILSKELKFWERDFKTKFVRCVYKFLRVFEVSFYYYFTPFIVLILTYLIAGQKEHKHQKEEGPVLGSSMQ